jgi:hypothetical protein
VLIILAVKEVKTIGTTNTQTFKKKVYKKVAQ